MQKNEKNKDLIIIGAGPAGLSAAIYASRAKLDLLVLENSLVGGQVALSSSIENYPGFDAISGTELAQKMQMQAQKFGAEIDEFDNIISVLLKDDEKIIETESCTYNAKSVIIATGLKPKKLPVPEEEKFCAKGIHYCALCDGALYEGKKIAVVGGGNSALEESLFLSRFGNVTIIRRHDYFNGEKAKLDEVMKNEKIKILWNKDITHVNGDNSISSIEIKDVKTGKAEEIECDAVFVSIGSIPKSDIFKDYINLNEKGYIITDENLKTNVKGVFAAGDVREKMFRQVTTAVSDGSVAALMAEKHINLKS